MKFKNLLSEANVTRLKSLRDLDALHDNISEIIDVLYRDKFPVDKLWFDNLNVPKPISAKQTIKLTKTKLDPRNVDHEDEFILLVCNHVSNGVSIYWGNCDGGKIWGLDKPEYEIGDTSGSISDAFVSTFFRNLMNY